MASKELDCFLTYRLSANPNADEIFFLTKETDLFAKFSSPEPEEALNRETMRPDRFLTGALVLVAKRTLPTLRLTGVSSSLSFTELIVSIISVFVAFALPPAARFLELSASLSNPCVSIFPKSEPGWALVVAGPVTYSACD